MERSRTFTTAALQQAISNLAGLEEVDLVIDNEPPVNYATTMSQLGRIRFVDRRDPLFRAFLDDYATNSGSAKGLRWLDAQGIGNIMHTMTKMNLKNESECDSTNNPMLLDRSRQGHPLPVSSKDTRAKH
eukprot:scaffold15863_cov49-Attheya_sp.AAC.1